MQVGLFIPCYIDQFYPDVAEATLEVLERFEVDVEFPMRQTCCGQPMANTGCRRQTQPLVEQFVEIFHKYPYIVCPSGSCVAMVRHQYRDYLPDTETTRHVLTHTMELCEFLVDVLNIEQISGEFPYQVGVHASCHALRGLRLGASSELQEQGRDKMRTLLAGLDGISFSKLDRVDECCGFGGTFAVNEEAVSCRMGLDRIADHRRAGTQVLTAPDMSCLMHLSGLLRRQESGMAVMHVAQILAGRTLTNGNED